MSPPLYPCRAGHAQYESRPLHVRDPVRLGSESGDVAYLEKKKNLLKKKKIDSLLLAYDA